jgi:hypothetical protein
MKYFFIVISCMSVCFANILEVSSISSMDSYKEDGVLFLYDIDNTLIHLDQMFGSDEWFFHRFSTLQKEGKAKEEALDIALCELISAHYASKVSEVEKGSFEIIKRQQRENIMLIGFTTRDHSLARITQRQLKSLGFYMGVSAPKQTQVFIKDDNCIFYQEGVLYTSGTHKGQALFTFLKMSNVYPKAIVFINDRRQNLEQVEETCIQKGVPFVGLRYNFLDKKAKVYNPEIAQVQRDSFFNILSDEQAFLKIK